MSRRQQLSIEGKYGRVALPAASGVAKRPARKATCRGQDARSSGGSCLPAEQGLRKPRFCSVRRSHHRRLASGGQILVRNEFISVEPAMRGWIADRGNYSVAGSDQLQSCARLRLSEVVESRHPDYPRRRKCRRMVRLAGIRDNRQRRDASARPRGRSPVFARPRRARSQRLVTRACPANCHGDR